MSTIQPIYVSICFWSIWILQKSQCQGLVPFVLNDSTHTVHHSFKATSRDYPSTCHQNYNGRFRFRLSFSGLSGSTEKDNEDVDDIEPCADKGFQDFLTQQGMEGLENTILGRSTSTQRRGVFAKRPISAGDVILRMSLDGAIEIEPTDTTDEERAYKFWHWFKCQGEMENNVYQPYLDLLPFPGTKDFDIPPHMWSDIEIEQLELPEVVEEVLERKQELERFAKNTQSENVAGYSLKELQTASYLVRSRAFSIIATRHLQQLHSCHTNDDGDDEKFTMDGEDAKVSCILIPYFDMINHSSKQPNARLEDDSEGDSTMGPSGIELVATQDIAQNQEILISYGTGADETIDLLLHYGFVPQNNPYDVAAYEGDDFQWSTSIDEDLLELRRPEIGKVRESCLKLRIKLKRAMIGLEE